MESHAILGKGNYSAGATSLTQAATSPFDTVREAEQRVAEARERVRDLARRLVGPAPSADIAGTVKAEKQPLFEDLAAYGRTIISSVNELVDELNRIERALP